MRLAIIGSRDYPDHDKVRAFVGKLEGGTVVISGGAPGVDRVAAIAARNRGLHVEEIRPDWDRLGKRAGFERNEDIVNAADGVIAFWTTYSRGTAHSIMVALRKNKPLRVCGPTKEIPLEFVRDLARDALKPKPKKLDEAKCYDEGYERNAVSTTRTQMLRRWAKNRHGKR